MGLGGNIVNNVSHILIEIETPRVREEKRKNSRIRQWVFACKCISNVPGEREVVGKELLADCVQTGMSSKGH